MLQTHTAFAAMIRISNEIAFSGFATPLHLPSGQELRLMIKPDGSDNNDAGETCADVYAKYV